MPNIADPLDAPRRRRPLLRRLARAGLRWAGWRLIGDVPRLPKFVAIVAPHTSNWDFVVGIGAMLALELDVRWFGKSSLFRPPFDAIFRALGGQPVRRDAPGGVVAAVADAIAAAPQCIVALAPEGTRSAVPQWRTGFYHIALRAGVPILPVALDWGRRAIVFGEPMTPTGDLAGDVAALRAWYCPTMARDPRGFVPEAAAAAR